MAFLNVSKMIFDPKEIWGSAKASLNLYEACLAVIFVIAIALRVGVPDAGRPITSGDEATYNYAALDMLRHGTLTREISGDMFNGKIPTVPTPALSPGYPLYIYTIYSLVGQSTRVVLSSHITLSILSFWLIYRLLLMLKLRRMAILIALALAAFYPGFLYNLDRMLTEQLFVTLFLGFTCAFLYGFTKGNIYLIGLSAVLLGCATHVRAQAFPFALLAAFLCIAYETRGKRVILCNLIVFFAALTLVMAPWWIRNILTFHRFILFSEAGEGARIWGSVPYFIDMGSSGGKVGEVVARNMSPNPSVYYRWRVFGFLQFMWGDVWDENVVHPGSFLRWMCMMQPFVVVPTLIATPLLILRRSSPATMFVAAVPILFTLMNFPFHGLPRYVYPAVPFVFVMAGILIGNVPRRPAPNVATGLSSAWQLFLDRWMRRSFLFVACTMSVFTFYGVYVFAYRENSEMSSYRLSRYMHVRISDVKKSVLIQSDRYDGSNLVIENTRKVGDIYVNDVDGPAVLKLNVPFAPAIGRVVTVVTMKMRGGFPFDYTTIYWTDHKVHEVSQDDVYRFPTSMFTKSKKVYIDGDVNYLMIVPYVFRGGHFRIDSIQVQKYWLGI